MDANSKRFASDVRTLLRNHNIFTRGNLTAVLSRPEVGVQNMPHDREYSISSDRHTVEESTTRRSVGGSQAEEPEL